MLKKFLNESILPLIPKETFPRLLKLSLDRHIDSKKYWEKRYLNGSNSGPGSYGNLALFKAEVVNSIIKSKNIYSVLELGCGDGNQISLFEMPIYIGFDVSKTAIKICKAKYKDDISKEFKLMKYYRGEQADLVLSLDVIFHLVEDSVFEEYMQSLFSAARKYVLIYSSNSSENSCVEAKHVYHRKFTDWIYDNRKDWTLAEKIANKYPYNGDFKESSFSDFYLYERL